MVSNYADTLIPSKLHFFPYIASISEYYLTVFQSDVPLVPFLFDALENFSQIVGSNLQKRIQWLPLAKKIPKKDLLMDKVNLQDLSKFDIGAAAQTALKELYLLPEKTRKFKADCHDII